ncbi:tetracenomycin polyketide synthesis O-methyltransferase TcmP [Chaetomium strumarium]|uniref:Tetracenomycin polyketide synthesis O-methyltransferase TcmP n=1 Tax=Chaetomium strumarium TaxID=1170767 RepID=A0AAJ0GRK5_9PEZI|nr:tetracenomycin polyketide synthesis O-methyltransferase TcmP [Chaetomium strumarium]
MSPPSPAAPTATASSGKITLTGAQETLLATLYGRALDATAKPKPVLGDRWAADTVRRIDYDFAGRTGIGAAEAASVALRARALDRWTADFLARHRAVTVVHLACGLDARCLRVGQAAAAAAGHDVRWIDVDLEDVVELRRKLFAGVIDEGGGGLGGGLDYALAAGSAAEPDAWLGQIPADRPTLVVFEGLTMYLREEEGRRLFESIVWRFRPVGGEIACDAFGSVAIRLQGLIKAVKDSGSVLHWAIDDPKLLETWCDGLRLVEDQLTIEMPGIEELPLVSRMQAWAVARIPYLREAGRLLRYEF